MPYSFSLYQKKIMVGLFVFVIFTQYTPLYDASLLLGNPAKSMKNFPTDFNAISGRCNTHFVLFSVIFGFFHVRSLKAEILHV